MFLPRSSLKLQRKSIVLLGKAPDGLPLKIAVHRGTSPDMYVRPIANALGYKDDPELWEGKLPKLVEFVQEIIDERQFFSQDKSSEEFYISNSSVKSLFGATILRRLLSDSITYTSSESDGMEDSRDYMDSRAYTADDIKEQALEKLHSSSPKLAIQTNGEKLALVRIKNNNNALWERYFIEENLDSLSTAEFCVMDKTDVLASGRFGKEYIRLRKQKNLQRYSWKLRVQIGEILQLLAGMTNSLYELHQKKLVHADLKPDNILLNGKNLVAIDSLNISVGEKSTGMTQKYAAPEQIMREDITPQTDQYALGVILSEILQGVVYGEEANFIIPTGGNNSARMTMLKNPGVFFDPKTGCVPKAAIPSVINLIKRCLAFHSTERFASVKEIGQQIQQLCKDHKFTDYLECPLHFGNIDEDNDNYYWWVEDNYR